MQVHAHMDAVRPDTERIVNAFGLSVKLVDIEWPNTNRHISVGVHQGHTTKEKHSENVRLFS